jgi:hypothetical protein
VLLASLSLAAGAAPADSAVVDAGIPETSDAVVPDVEKRPSPTESP